MFFRYNFIFNLIENQKGTGFPILLHIKNRGDAMVFISINPKINT